MTRNLVRKIIGGLSFTSVLFVFQACYGTMQDLGYDVLVEGQVKSKTTGQPIKGIKVSPINGATYKNTDDEGKFSFYTPADGTLALRFEDVDNSQNGTFQTKDTTLKNVVDMVYVNIALEDK